MSQPALQVVQTEPTHKINYAQALTPAEKVAQAAELQRGIESRDRMAQARQELMATRTQQTVIGEAAVESLMEVTSFMPSGQNKPAILPTTRTNRPDSFISKAFFIEASIEDPKTVVVIPNGVAGEKHSVLNLVGSFQTTCETEAEATQMVSDLKAYKDIINPPMIMPSVR